MRTERSRHQGEDAGRLRLCRGFWRGEAGDGIQEECPLHAQFDTTGTVLKQEWKTPPTGGSRGQPLSYTPIEISVLKFLPRRPLVHGTIRGMAIEPEVVHHSEDPETN
jgi:hypothetical protein